jgi:limonene 1,2-monooxygenase
MGIQPIKQRDMMDEALDVIVRLLKGETVSAKTDWFELVEARLQLTPFTRPHVEIAGASQVSPTGARAAGRLGVGLLSIGATSAGGFNALASNWAIAEEQAKEHGLTVDRDAWRLVGPMHVAETTEKARENVRFGLHKWISYFRDVAALPLAGEGDGDPIDMMIASGMAVIGTPDDAIAQIERLQSQSGGFGCFLQMAHNWADWAQTQRSYELIARHVAPKFQGSNVNRDESYARVGAGREATMGQARAAIGASIFKHVAEKGTDNIRPEILEVMGMAKKPDAAE